MSFKTLTVKVSVYEKLLAMKRENESFSDLFERLSKNNIETLRKLHGCTKFEKKDQMLREIEKKRKEQRYV
ncbi:MAG: antitoxin VapB family protein [Candidatus Thermoplasmatota archaeon]|nr:antitoxin VapB family protein [Candidatus Thermoplasmatota archaeon]